MVDFRRRVRRGALVAGLFGLALMCALASKAAAVGTTATASDTPASAPSTMTTVELEAGSESQVAAPPEPASGAEPLAAAAPEPAPGAQPQAAAAPEPAPGAESQETAAPDPAPGAESQEPATAEPASPGTSEPELAPRAEPHSPGTAGPAPRVEPQTALAMAPTAIYPGSIVTQTRAASPRVARAVRPAPRRPATLSAAGPWRAAASPLPFALAPAADVTSLPALGPSASSRGPDAAADRTKRRRAEGADVEQGPRSPLGPLDRTFHAASSAAPGGGAAPDLIWWCIIVLGLAAYRPQTLRRHCVRQVARRLVGFASFHEQPG